MKIAYFTDTYAPEINGVANTLEKLSGYLEKKGIQHAFFAPDYNDEAEEGKLSIFSRMREVYCFKGLKAALSPNSSLSFPPTRVINSLCDGFRPDLVHVTTELGIGYKGMKYALSRNLPLVTSYHTDFCKYLQYHNLKPFEPFVERYLKWFHSFSAKTLVPSAYTLKQLMRKGYNNLDIWSRGVDTSKFNAGFRSEEVRRFWGINGKFAFLYVGRLSPEKGLHMLLYAIEKMNRCFPGETAFIFTGDGPYAETIQNAGFDNVIMTGAKRGRELSEIYASCDCFAFPSGTETFGNTPLEAMASGLPVVGINSGGVTDFLLHRGNALLSAEKDQEAFAMNLMTMLQNKALHRLLSENAVKTARSRGWNEIFGALLGNYAVAMEKRAAASLIRAS